MSVISVRANFGGKPSPFVSSRVPGLSKTTSTKVAFSPKYSPFTGDGVRFGNTLKEVRIRIKSVKSIEKITKTMKMIASSRLKGVQTRLMKARPFWEVPSEIFAEFKPENPQKKLFVAVTSDRGLCGGINTNLAKLVRSSVAEERKDPSKVVKVALIGDKAVPLLTRQMGKDIFLSVHETAKKPMHYSGVGVAFDVVLKDTQYDAVTIFYNKYHNVMSFEASKMVIPSASTMLANKDLYNYQFEDDNAFFQSQDLFEFGFASALYVGVCENVASELSARVAAMESASKNAGDMLKRLTIFYNRGRQAAITTELTEIVAGASAIAK